MSTAAVSTRARYRAGWVAWREFCPGLEISPKLDPDIPDWGAPLHDFSTWERKIMGVGHSGLDTRYDAARLVGGCDISKDPFHVRSFPKSV